MTPKGSLYIVATPIGNLADISLRALQVLKTVDLIAAEDTRQSKKLLTHYAISTPMISLHNYNEKQRGSFLLDALSSGKNIAIISDAGTPLISDPGYNIALLAHANKIKIIPIPGACAAIAALCASGLPTDRFIFEGFLPAKAVLRKNRLLELEHESRTMIFYESPHRMLHSLEDMISVFGKNRLATLARELTKVFETIYKTSLEELLSFVKTNPMQLRGEIIILVEGAKETPAKSTNFDAETMHLLKVLSKELPPNQAVKLATKILPNSVNKKKLYNAMVDLKKTS